MQDTEIDTGLEFATLPREVAEDAIPTQRQEFALEPESKPDATLTATRADVAKPARPLNLVSSPLRPEKGAGARRWAALQKQREAEQAERYKHCTPGTTRLEQGRTRRRPEDCA